MPRYWIAFIAALTVFGTATTTASAEETPAAASSQFIRYCTHVRTVRTASGSVTTQTRYTPTGNRCVRATGTVIGVMPSKFNGTLVSRYDLASCVDGTHHPSVLHRRDLATCAPVKGVLRELSPSKLLTAPNGHPLKGVSSKA